MAERAGLPSASEYWDLELRDDEAFTCISVLELYRIAGALGTTGSQLLFGQEIGLSPDAADFATISTRLTARVSDEQTTAEALGETIGWDITEVLQNPVALATFSVVGFRDVCKAARVDWVEAFLSAGARPPNDDLQRTRPAQAMEPRR